MKSIFEELGGTYRSEGGLPHPGYCRTGVPAYQHMGQEAETLLTAVP